MKLLVSLLTLAAHAAALAVSPRANNLQPTVSGTNIAISPSGGGTYPRLTSLSDGSVLGSFTAFSGSTKILTVTRSTDGARTFSAWGTISPPGRYDVSREFLLWGWMYLSLSQITATISHDSGRTWSFLSQVDQRTRTATNNGLWEPFIRIARSGAIQVYYAAENNSGDQDILMRSSTNNGLTWSGATTVAGATTTGRDGMPGCADYTASGQARVICIFETTEGTAPFFTVKSVISTNDGVSFSSRATVYVPTGSGHNAGAPQIVTTSAGTLVAGFMTDEEHSGGQRVAARRSI
ncbi:Sialidase domain-containing protein [Mycena kentingensis (nom. inval.)]|nr:Sialidase domain-containing protein [Mycena kentingensis (nom. inval.)]